MHITRFVPGRAENPDGVQAYKAIGDSGQFNSGVTIQVNNTHIYVHEHIVRNMHACNILQCTTPSIQAQHSKTSVAHCFHVVSKRCTVA
jgi:hypothetical protein